MRVLAVEGDETRHGDLLITVEVGFWLWKRTVTYGGDCTVWHDVESGVRASTWMESRLADVEWRYRYNNRKKS